MLKTGKREQMGERTLTTKQEEAQQGATLFNKTLRSRIGSMGTGEEGRRQEDTANLMEPMEECHRDKDLKE